MSAEFQAMAVEAAVAASALESAATAFHWTEKQWALSLADDHCFGLREDSHWLAVSAYQLALDEATLLNLAVHPRYQGRGLARTLLRAGLREMAALGARHCFLEVRRSNSVAQSLYRSLDFADIGTRRGYYPTHDGREDALVMMCTLPLPEIST